MKIVHVITRFLNAGAEENTLFSCNGQAEAGHEVTLITGAEVASEKRQALHPNVTIHQIPSLVRNIHPIKDRTAYKVMTDYLIRTKPDIVHTHTSKAGVIGRLAAKKANVPTIIHTVHILAFENVSALPGFIYKTMEKLAAPATDAFIHVSKGTKEACVEAGIGIEKPHFVIASGMDITAFKELPETNWRDYIPPEAISTDNPHFVLFTGAFETRKRHIPFLEMFKTIVTRHPDTVLLLLGEGNLRQEIEAKITELHLQKNVILLGFQKDIRPYLTISLVGVLPSLREGLARVLIQYSLAGLPIITTKTAGLGTVWKDGVHGYFLDSDDINAFKEPLITLLQEKNIWQDMHDAQAELDFTAWDTQTMVDGLEDVYRQIHLGAPPANTSNTQDESEDIAAES